MLYQPIGNYSQNPYHMEELGVGIHTLEELCFFLKQNATTLEESIMKPQLCSFVKRELGLRELGDALSELVAGRGSLSTFVRLILEECGFVSEEEMRSIEVLLRRKTALGAGERRKSHGDYHLLAGRYLKAHNEYSRAIAEEDETMDDELRGALEHNLGCALAGMFLYEAAAEHFKKAMALGEKKSGSCYLACMRMVSSRREYARMSSEMGFDTDTAKELEAEIREADSGFDRREYRIAEMVRDLDSGNMGMFREKSEAFLRELEQEYSECLNG